MAACCISWSSLQASSLGPHLSRAQLELAAFSSQGFEEELGLQSCILKLDGRSEARAATVVPSGGMYLLVLRHPKGAFCLLKTRERPNRHAPRTNYPLERKQRREHGMAICGNDGMRHDFSCYLHPHYSMTLSFRGTGIRFFVLEARV